jgi:protein Mpv17
MPKPIKSRIRMLRAALTSCSLYAIGDAINQKVFKGDVNLIQTLKFSIVGLTLHGPYFYRAFQLLDARYPQRTLTTAIRKALVGQVVIFPPYTALFLGYTSLLDQKQFDPMKLVDINLNGLLVWPAANILNFYLVPPAYRIAYINSIGIFWNTYLSYVSNKG